MQVLLSCSHSFHLDCLQNLERFAAVLRCPVCRAEGYQRKLIDDGRVAYIQRCAILIQAQWRGYIQRQRYRELRVHVRPAHPLLVQGWLEDKVQWNARNLVLEFKRHGEDLEALFAECDHAVAGARSVLNNAMLQRPQVSRLAACSPDNPISSAVACLNEQDDASTSDALQISVQQGPPKLGNCVHWADVLCGFHRRGQNECPICMAALCRSKKRKKACDLLSCGHAFHTTCIAAFEAYHDGSKTGQNCPVCRADYSRHTIKYEGLTWKLQQCQRLKSSTI
jgi:hypothetical protein